MTDDQEIDIKLYVVFKLFHVLVSYFDNSYFCVK